MNEGNIKHVGPVIVLLHKLKKKQIAQQVCIINMV